MKRPTPFEFAQVILKVTIIPVLILLLILFSSCSKSELPKKEFMLSGTYEVAEMIVETPQGTSVYEAGTGMLPERLVFMNTKINWYVFSNGEWVDQGSVPMTVIDGRIVKVGCRNVLSYSEDHIAWDQDDWIITRKFE